MIDITNKTFGLLTVTSYGYPAKRSRGRHYWNCHCQCGNETVVRDSHLGAGTIRSCGCLHKRRGSESPFFKGHGEIPLDVFSRIRRSAIGGGILNRKSKQFCVTIEYLWELFLKQDRKCAVTGFSIEFSGTTLENKCRETSKLTASLDRIDSKQGYIEGNVHWVHKTINIMKNDLPLEEFVEWCKRVSNNH